MPITLEVCLTGVESALAAQEGGADRVELCENLFEGGTTPSHGTIALALEQLEIDVNVMIRPRGGDFCYSQMEFAVMKHDVEAVKALGAPAVVFGILAPDGSIDALRTQELVDLARPMGVTFHRAFDVTRDPFAALETLVELGVDRVLTSGQENTAFEGMELLAELVRRAGDRIHIMVCGGVNGRNARRIVEGCGATEIHVGPGSDEGYESSMRYRNVRVPMGGELRPPEFFIRRTSAEAVAAVRMALR